MLIHIEAILHLAVKMCLFCEIHEVSIPLSYEVFMHFYDVKVHINILSPNMQL